MFKSNIIDNEKFNQFIIDINRNIIFKRQIGLLDSDKKYIETMMSVVCQQAIQHMNLFNEQQEKNIIYISNKLLHV